MSSDDPNEHQVIYDVLNDHFTKQRWYAGLTAGERVCVRWALADAATVILERERATTFEAPDE